MRLAVALLLAVTSLAAQAQWEIEESHTTSGLRGIHNVGAGIAWASGTGGTVLRTEDGGYLWQTCAIPPGAEKLDFRGIQAFDENTAIVMSSGPGDQSRLYKTTDGCQTWKLLFTNPDKDGFWDGFLCEPKSQRTVILGDPVGGPFRLFTAKLGEDMIPSSWNGPRVPAAPNQAAFAASNSLLIENRGEFSFITGGGKSEFITGAVEPDFFEGALSSKPSRTDLPFATGENSGAFSVAAGQRDPKTRIVTVLVVGGDYKRPDDSAQTAAVSLDSGYTWRVPKNMPHGYRSAVAFEEKTESWITVGPNGTDISTDDGRNWRPLTPTPQDDKDADKNWNALSLPFVVGPKGRIGKLRTNALPAISSK